MDIFFNSRMLPCIERFLCETQDKIYTHAADLSMSYYKTPEPVPYSQKDAGEYRRVGVGEKWGELWDCAWFHAEGEVPACCAGKNTVVLLDVSGEGCVYDNAGTPLRGITSVGTFDPLLGTPLKRVCRISESAAGGEKLDFYLDAGCNDLFGNYQTGVLKQAEIAVCRENVRAFYYDYYTLLVLLKQLPESSARYVSVLRALYDASNLVTEYTDGEIAAAERPLKKELSKKGGSPSLSVSALGHSHLDLAWLWPIRETKRKAVRTFSTAVTNLAEYPDYIFCASQPQQYQWVKENEPALYEKIKEQVAAGRIEPVGALWVEPDLNVSGGESLVRQVLYGKKFFKEEFGKDVDNAWLPDVFGFNAALPQILAKSGVRFLLTIKLSWNRYNKFPHHSFVWQALDGSEVLVHMPPEGTYNSAATPESVKKAETEYFEKGISENAMMLFGIGDGGGGPGESHLECLKREKNVDGLCPVEQRTAKEFFQRLEKERGRLPRYKGEMYLEKHQGTYTTQSDNKYYDARMERLLTAAELASVMAMERGARYPQAEFDRIWKEVLLYEFHDILPGSSIKRVYDESVARYRELEAETEELLENALSALSSGDAPAVWNPTGVERSEYVKHAGVWHRVTVPATGSLVLTGETRAAGKYALKADAATLENAKIRVKFGANGEIVSAYDKESKREILSSGNCLNVYCDDGDGWDISDNYLEKRHGKFVLEGVRTEIDGPTAVRTQTLTYGDSTFKQTITLTADEAYLTFECEANWQEQFKMLRADFRTNVSADTAEYGIQFGKVTRRTTSNNLAEFAQNEACAKKWVDYSQPDFGVSIVSPSKHGYRIKGGTISLNLLRSPEYPGESADRGTHRFSYSVYLHGAVRETEQLAERLTNPLIPAKEGLPARFAWWDAKNVALSSVKKCEYDDSVIVRLYEFSGAYAAARFVAPGFSKLTETDMTERPDGKAVPASGAELKFSPFEIKTIRLTR